MTKSKINRSLAICGTLGVLCFATPVQAASVDLGSASPLDWLFLSIGGNTVTVNNESVVRDFDENGENAGADSRQSGIQGEGGKLQMSGGAYIGGPVRLSSGSNLGITSGNSVEGGIYGSNLSGDPKDNMVFDVAQDSLLDLAASDAQFYSGHYAGLTATDSSITSITDTLSIGAAVAGQNVINVSTLQLGGDEVLTLDGGGTDSSFIINIDGDLKLNSGRVELTGGLTFDEVLFNVGGKVSFSGGGNSSILMGTILALGGETAISPGLIQGTLIGTKISLVSGADLDTPLPSPIPLPAAAWLFGTALIGLIGYGRRRKSDSV